MTKTPFEIIHLKSSGTTLSSPQIEKIVNGYTSEKISDSQMTKWLQAIIEHGMNYEETLDYTRAMINSGTRLEFSHLDGYVLDKHSTGGVGDKVSLILGPLLAACGCFVPMLAGRGLEHTGGTIDKLESIPGYKTTLSLAEFKNAVETVGVSIMEQTREICPADRKIYALRNATGTVASLPLICGSIMSKKIAEGIQGLVLDIKVGNGAFMKSLNQAKELGSLLKEVGKLYGLKVTSCYTDMNQPLGNKAGLWCEVEESVECLKGKGPTDLMKIVNYLGEEALKLAAIDDPLVMLKSAINNGYALNKFKEMIAAHGGFPESLENTETHEPLFRKQLISEKNGYITGIDALKLGQVLVHLGAGRIHKDDHLDFTAGIQLHKKFGDKVKKSEGLIDIFCSDPDKIETGYEIVRETIQISTEKSPNLKLIY